MKIALGKSYFAGPVSGADETLVTYAAALRAAGEDVSVVLMYRHTSDDPYFDRLRRAGVSISCVIRRSFAFAVLRSLRGMVGSLFFFLFLERAAPSRLRSLWQRMLNLISRLHYRECRDYFAANRPDVLHVFTPDSGAELMIRVGHELGIPVIYQELGTPHYLPALETYYRRLEKVLPLCSEVGALSPALAAQWQQKFPFLRSLSVMPLMVDDEGGKRTAARRHSSTNETVFGYAARFEQGKGPLLLIRALEVMKLRSVACVVRMAGLGPQLKEAKTKVRELGLNDACEFVGYFTEPAGRSSFLSSLDVFVLPSLAEGTPNSIVEAMAHGLPTIASAVGGIPDLLSHGAGLLVPPGDAGALARAMERLAHDPELRERMGRAARDQYLKLFSPEAVLPILKSTYQRVAGKRQPQPAVLPLAKYHPWEESPAEI